MLTVAVIIVLHDLFMLIIPEIVRVHFCTSQFSTRGLDTDSTGCDVRYLQLTGNCFLFLLPLLGHPQPLYTLPVSAFNILSLNQQLKNPPQ